MIFKAWNEFVSRLFLKPHTTLWREICRGKSEKKLIHYVTFRTLNKVTLVLYRVGRKSLDPRGKNKRNILPPSTARTILFLDGTSSVIMHGQFLRFSVESDRNFLSKNFLSFLNFARIVSRIASRLFNLQRIFSMKVFLFLFYTRDKKKLDTTSLTINIFFQRFYPLIEK